MTFDQRARNQLLEKQREIEEDKLATKRSIIISVVLIILGGIILLGGCASVETCVTTAKPIELTYTCSFQ